MPTEPAVTAPSDPHPRADAPPAAEPPAEDIRASRSYLLSPRPLRALVRRVASIGTLVLLDLSGLALGLYAALAARELYHGRTPLWGLLWDGQRDWFPFLALVTLLVFWRAGLYSDREHRPGAGSVVSSLALVAVLALAFALASGHEFGTYAFAPTAVVFCAIVIGLLRASYGALTSELMRISGVRRRAVLVGDHERVAHLRRTLGSSRRGIGYEFLGAVGPVGSPDSLGDLAGLPSVLQRTEVDELIVIESDLDDRDLLELVDHAHRAGVKVRVAPTTTELLTQRGEYVPGQAVPLFELRPPVFAGTDWAVKRTFDLVVSAAVVVVGLPLWLVIAAAVKLDSRGPVLYRDTRVGLGERKFEMFKFRTMYVDAARLQPELEALNEADGPLFKIRQDPRVTRVGAVLRRFSLDETPQVLNVLRGEMSLVGPRPLPLRDFSRLADWHRKRYHVLPGMTGLWQISGRSGLTFDDLVRLDFYYLDNWSIWLDVSILAKTIPAVLAAKGAY